MPPNARVCYIGLIIDLLLAVLENIAVGYLGYRPYTLEQETILQMINHVRGTLMYYTVGLPRVPDAKTGKKRPRSTRGSGGDARNSSDNDDEAPSDDDDEAGAGPSDTRSQAATDFPTMCSVCGKEICPVCGKCHGSPFWSSASSDCVEVEVVEDSPVAMTISSSGDDGPKGGSDSSSVSSAALRLYRSAAEDENTGGADAGLKEGQDVPSSSSSDDDGEK
jgi:hypothetical protein